MSVAKLAAPSVTTWPDPAPSGTPESTPAPTIHELDPAGAAAWDAYVEGHPEASFFHRAGWKRVIEEALRHACHFLYAERDGRICGLLPLVHIKSRLFANALVSTGFCVQGGPLADDAAARQALETAAVARAEALGVDYLEFRLTEASGNDWARNDALYVTFRKALDPDPDKNLLAIPRKQRAMVRKGIKLGLAGEIDETVERFFPVYAESVRNLGTPVLPRRFFSILKEVFGSDCEVLTVVHEGTPVASVMSFYFRDEVLPYYGGGSAAARGVAANDFMYWAVMKQACERGCGLFDFGRSKRGTGAFDFKRHWGFEPTPLVYEYKLLRCDEPPAFNPLNPKYRAFIALWQRLPLGIASALGPFIARELG